MNDLANKYVFKLAKSVDSVILVLQVIKNAPDKAFQEDIDERIKALDTVIAHLQDAKRWLVYFKNRRSKPSSTDFVRFP